MDQMSAIQSACSWDIVLKMANSIPGSVWFLHVAAAEALLFNHAGHPVDPSGKQGMIEVTKFMR